MDDGQPPTLMLREAQSARDVVSRQLALNRAIMEKIADAAAAQSPSVVITCARGSSDHAAVYLKYVLETRAGILTASLAPSVASLYNQWPHVPDAVCVAISQSGKSTDLLSVVTGMKAVGVTTVCIVNDCESPLARMADYVIPLHAGEERSVAATKSFIGSLLAALQLADSIRPGLIRQEELRSVPSLLDQAWELNWGSLVSCLEEAQGLYVLGRGVGLSVAGEAALKFKETCNLHAEAYSAAEVRHGPMTLFNKDFPVLMFRQNDATADGVDELAALAVQQGCRVFVVGGNVQGAVNLETIDASPLIAPILQIQTFYKAVNTLALTRGRDPDNPPLLKKVTVTL